MVDTTFSVKQDVFLKGHSPIFVECIHESALSKSILLRFLDSCSDGILGVAAVYGYGNRCVLTSMAFSTPSCVLLIRFSGSMTRNQRHMEGTARDILRDHVFCHSQLQLYGFQMDRIAAALYLDLSLRIRAGVDILSASKRGSRHSLDALMDVLGGEHTLNKLGVKSLFRQLEGAGMKQHDTALQAWVASQVGTLSTMSQRVLAVPRIDTYTMLDTHLVAFAKISRDGNRLDALKPIRVKNDVKANSSAKGGNLNVESTRFKTRIMQSRSQTLEITMRVGNKHTTVQGRAKKVEGRGAKISVNGSVKGKTVVSITTVGKDEQTAAEAQRETLVLRALQKKVALSSQPFFQSIWLPAEKPYWPPFPAHSLATIYSPEQPLNASQELAVQKILSTNQNDRIVVIQGPPGTGKTSVIAASVTSITDSNDPNRTIWIAAQSNVAVKNIAEKLAKVGFFDFKVLVSKDFHFDWHKHLYEQLSQRVVRSDSFTDDAVGASRLIHGSRVMLCTLSMLSNRKLDVFTRLVPISILIFDEASQIEVGDYIPVFHRFQTALRKVVFIGDDKQLAPYGQDDIGDLRSIFEFPHIRRRACFLDTQYRMPVVIGQFISRQVYDGKLRTNHLITSGDACRFVDVQNGEEQGAGNSWQNREESAVVIHIARSYHKQGKLFRIVTPYDAQRNLIEKELQHAKLPWEDKCFNVDSFQGNEEDHIIISIVRSNQIGFLTNVRRTNVMLTRCKKSMIICTSRSFVTGIAQKTLIGRLAVAMGPSAWMDKRDVIQGDIL